MDNIIEVNNRIANEMADGLDSIVSKSFNYKTDSRLVWPKEMILAKYDTLRTSHDNLFKIIENLVKAGETNSKVKENLPWTLEQAKQALAAAEEKT